MFKYNGVELILMGAIFSFDRVRTRVVLSDNEPIWRTRCTNCSANPNFVRYFLTVAVKDLPI